MATLAHLLVGAVVCLLFYLGLILWKANLYWKVRGVKHFKPWPLVGNFARTLTFQRHVSYYYDEVYKAFPNERMVGLHEFLTPTLVLRDPALVEKVLIREFSTYPDHGSLFFEPSSINYESVFVIGGVRWRALRNKMASVFSTGRMRIIFPEIVNSCQSLVDSNPKWLDNDLVHDFALRSFMGSMFGTMIQPDDEKELMTKSKEAFMGKLLRYLQQTMLVYFPKIADSLNMKFMPKSLDSYFRGLLNAIVEQRDMANGRREDFTQVLCDLKKMGKMNVFNRENNKTEDTFDITNNMVLAQAFMLLFAGLDTTNLLILHAAFELSLAKDCQEKARQEVRSVLKKHGGYSWEAVREMKYLDQCMQETLRLHPPVQFIVRVSDKDTEIDGVKIKKDTRIIIPTHSIHMDPNNFPNPDVFDPERFKEPLTSTSKCTHLPFSIGPRECLGKKFALMESATILAHILDNFQLHPSPETKLPIKYNPNALFHAPISNDEMRVVMERIT